MKIYAFCILPRSVYLILQPKDKKDLPLFVQSIKELYKQYFQSRYGFAREVWPSVYQCEPLLTDHDLLLGIKSIEFTPVVAEISENPISYPWSSCSHRVFNHKNGILDR